MLTLFELTRLSRPVRTALTPVVNSALNPLKRAQCPKRPVIKGAHAKRARRGLSLLDATLAMIIGAIVITQVAQFLEHQLRQRALLREAQLLSDLTEVGRTLVLRDESQFTAGTAQLFTLAALEATGALRAGKTAYSATGRDLTLFVARRSANEIVVLARAAVPTGETREDEWAVAGAGIGLIGTVRAESPNTLLGPSLEYDLSWMVGNYASAKPQVGDLVGLEVIRSDQSLEPYLHRVAVPLNPALNTMATDLNLGGHDIVDAGAVSAQSAAIVGTITTDAFTGTSEFVGPVSLSSLTASSSIEVLGNTAVEGVLRAESADVAGDVSAGALQSTSATIGGSLSAGDAAITGALNAQSFATERLEVTDIQAGTARMDMLDARQITALGLISSTQGEFEAITTGSCTGC